MVEIASPFDETSYCIDRHEVTAQQYAAFLRAKGDDTGGQPDACSANGSFEPDGTYDPPSGGICHDAFYDPLGAPDAPVRCVDWCDAHAYCTWSGKRLCGRIGGGSGFWPDSDRSASEWAHACSNGGTTTYTYGDAYDAASCNTDGEQPHDAAALTGCHGTRAPYHEIRDLTGNLAEWEDACDLVTLDPGYCVVAGGSYASHLNATCASDGGERIDRRAAHIGIRCCAD